jgi:hypothetical protein
MAYFLVNILALSRLMYWHISSSIYRLYPGYCTGLFPGLHSRFVEANVLADFHVNILALSRLLNWLISSSIYSLYPG